jgi:hypothetical protein
MLKNRQSGKREKGIQTAGPFLFRIKGRNEGRRKQSRQLCIAGKETKSKMTRWERKRQEKAT